MLDNRERCCAGVTTKVSIVLSVIALAVSAATYFCPKKAGNSVETSATFDEKVKGLVMEVVKENPQMLMDAMGEGMAKKREAAIATLSNTVVEKSADISKLSLKFGKMDSKTSMICFFDPLDRHSIEFLTSMTAIVKSNKDVCFKLLPVAVLGDDSVTLANVFLAAYDKSPEKTLAFIEKITSKGSEMDKSAIEKALKDSGLDIKEIEGMVQDSGKKLAENVKLAESMKLPIVPAIFVQKGKTSKMLQTVDVEHLVEEIEK